MRLARTFCRARKGIQAPLVTIEAHLANGLPNFFMVGLPEKAVKESKERVRSALLNTHFDYPDCRITINLAPADLPKFGGRYDLAIAISILAASGQIPRLKLNEYEFAAELTLAGDLRSVHGILPIAIATAKAGRMLIVAETDASLAALVDDLVVIPANTLTAVCSHLCDETQLTPQPPTEFTPPTSQFPNLANVIGQPHAKRALEIAASGNHSMLMIGPPGSGKTLLSQCLAGILPPPEKSDALEIAALASLSHQGDIIAIGERPFRSPHHSISSVAMVGGGAPLKPGEISLAHLGVLFLDELPEFRRDVLEALREPLENGHINIARVNAQENFPARFQLISAMNPCPCGYALDPERCHCSAPQIKRYCQKVSGPLLDRIDLHLLVAPIPHQQLLQQNSHEEGSEQVRIRVSHAQQRQLARQHRFNNQLNSAELKQFATLEKECEAFLIKVVDKLQLSARSIHRVIKVARTIADLASEEQISETHLTEALSFRPKLDLFE